MDEQGRVIGSGAPSRLQQKHEGAVYATVNRSVDLVATAQQEAELNLQQTSRNITTLLKLA